MDMLLRIFSDAPQPALRSLGVPNERLENTPGLNPTASPHNNIDETGESLELSERVLTDTQSLKQGLGDIAENLDSANAIEVSFQEKSGIIDRLRNLASQAATESISATEHEALNEEFDQLKTEFDRASELQKLGSENFDLNAVNSTVLGFSDENIATPQEALHAMDALVEALGKLTELKTEVGSVRAKLEKALGSLNVSIENFTAAESGVRDAKFASELTLITRDQILDNSATAMVGQANLIPQGVIELVEGQ
jgi:flagellin